MSRQKIDCGSALIEASIIKRMFSSLLSSNRRLWGHRTFATVVDGRWWELCTGYLLAVGALLIFAPRGECAVYDPALDFSASSNPAGVWSYGSRADLASLFSQYTVTYSYTANISIDAWAHAATYPDDYPAIVHNGTTLTWDNGLGAVISPGALVIAPGSRGELSDLRFTAPSSGIFHFSGLFDSAQQAAGSLPGATSDVHVLRNGQSLVDGSILRYGDAVNFSETVNMVAGDTLDFLVGVGPNGNNYGDSVGLSLNITDVVVPEPSTVITGALLLLPLAATTIRRIHKH